MKIKNLNRQIIQILTVDTSNFALNFCREKCGICGYLFFKNWNNFSVFSDISSLLLWTELWRENNSLYVRVFLHYFWFTIIFHIRNRLHSFIIIFCYKSKNDFFFFNPKNNGSRQIYISVNFKGYFFIFSERNFWNCHFHCCCKNCIWIWVKCKDWPADFSLDSIHHFLVGKL